jgi:2-polyprenyl-6-methoxyphenol hydroxylase-like FAD-dependent oxidoreductase
LKVAIVGGGVGGLTAAIALAAKGIDVEVCEQARTVNAVGASLQLGPNALRLMGELGLLPALRRIGVLPDAVDFIRWDDGSPLLHMPMGPEMEDHFGAPQLDFFRPELHRLLAESLPSGTLRLGARAVGVEQRADSVRILLADGPTVTAEVAVAADGIRSIIRQQLFGADDPVFSGTVVYRGVAPCDRVIGLHPERVNYYWLGPYRHGVSYWISAGRRLAVNCAVQHAEWSQESWTLAAAVEDATPYFEGWHAPLLERILACEIFMRGAVFVRQPLERWSNGRVALLGDAAHAMEPFQAQGAAQAVEDAYVLAACLADGADDPVGALSTYEAIRRGRAEELQASSHTAANVLYLPDGPEQRARDASYATLAETQPYGPRQRIWEYDVRDALVGLSAESGA